MLIQDIFEKDIKRNIEPVIQAEYNNDKVRAEELDEFVLTSEGEKQLKLFLQNFVGSREELTTATSVWISGLYGSGKSHFMKIVGYLLENLPTDNKHPMDYLIAKTQDPELKELFKRAVETRNDTITFNISAQQSASNKDKYGIAEAMYNQFNHLIGFSKNSKIAQVEHMLSDDGQYDAFCEAYERINGVAWKDVREKVRIQAGKADKALSAIGYNSVPAKDLFKEELSLKVDEVVQLFADYAKKQGADYRLIFLIDEISQYIGNRQDLTLELQTIAELAGSKGLGQVWVIVTSQKSLTDVFKDGDHIDFSTIMARFKNRINLSSSNTDEVIKKRLLQKSEAATLLLREEYQKNQELMRTRLAFKPDTTSLPSGYKDEQEFIEMYPLVPYEVTLLQKIFEKIREQGEGGTSTSRGERSLLAAVQDAILQKLDCHVGELVTMADFYPKVEKEINDKVSTTISNAGDLVKREELNPFDLPVLQLLYFIRGLETTVARPELENLATMLLSNIGAIRSHLMQDIESSLADLAKRMFVTKKIDGTYEFLTTEEMKANEAIKQILIEDSSIQHTFQKIYLETVLPPAKRAVSFNKRTIGFEAYFDENRVAGPTQPLTVKTYTEERSVLSVKDGTVRIHYQTEDGYEIKRLIERMLKVSRFISDLRANGLESESRKIIASKLEEEKELEDKIYELIKKYADRANFYVNDDLLLTAGGSFEMKRDEAFKQALSKTFNKMNFIDSTLELREYKEEWKKIASNIVKDIDAQMNKKAIEDVRGFIDFQNKSMMVNTLSVEDIVGRYTVAPYGWEVRDTIATLLRLIADGTFKLTYQGKNLTVENSDLITLLDKANTRQNILIELIKQANDAEIKALKATVKECFGEADLTKIGTTYDEIGPYLDELMKVAYFEPVRLIKEKMNQLTHKPGKGDLKEIEDILAGYPLSQKPEAKVFWVNKYGKEQLLSIEEMIEDLADFYGTDGKFLTYREALDFYKTNTAKIGQDILDGNDKVKTFEVLMRSEDLPGSNLKQIGTLMTTIKQEWESKIDNERKKAEVAIKGEIQKVDGLNPDGDADFADVIQNSKARLEQLISQIAKTKDTYTFSTNSNRARQILEDTKQEINRIQQDRIKVETPEIKIISMKSETLMKILFKGQTKLTSEAEVNQALERLKKELMAQLEEGTIIPEL